MLDARAVSAHAAPGVETEHGLTPLRRDPQLLRRRLHPAERTFPPSQIAISQKSKCTTKPIDLPTAFTIALTAPSSCRSTMREPRANDTDRYALAALAAQSGKSQGPPPKKHGLAAHRPTGLHQLRSPREPLSRSTDRKIRPGRNPDNRFSCPDRQRSRSSLARNRRSSATNATVSRGRSARGLQTPAAYPTLRPNRESNSRSRSRQSCR
jgi:hypothetical protein